MLSHISTILSHFSKILSHVNTIVSQNCTMMSHICKILSHISKMLYHIFKILAHKCLMKWCLLISAKFYLLSSRFHPIIAQCCLMYKNKTTKRTSCGWNSVKVIIKLYFLLFLLVGWGYGIKANLVFLWLKVIHFRSGGWLEKMKLNLTPLSTMLTLKLKLTLGTKTTN